VPNQSNAFQNLENFLTAVNREGEANARRRSEETALQALRAGLISPQQAMEYLEVPEPSPSAFDTVAAAHDELLRGMGVPAALLNEAAVNSTAAVMRDSDHRLFRALGVVDVDSAAGDSYSTTASVTLNSNLPYTPANPSHWPGPLPRTVGDALDQLAALMSNASRVAEIVVSAPFGPPQNLATLLATRSRRRRVDRRLTPSVDEANLSTG
jgi:hypothetical protein